MMKLVLPLLIFFIISSSAFSQNAGRQNNIYFELFGNAGAYSLNYDRVVWNNFSTRAGIMLLYDNDKLIKSFPILVNYRVYLNDDYIETGIGLTIFSLPFELVNYNQEIANGVLLTGRISYCLTSSNGMNSSVSFTPLYINKRILPFLGFSIGYSF